jgi:glutamyl/glutaminyl-tRNA synthetase
VKTHVDCLVQLPQETTIVYGFESDPPELDGDAKSTLQLPEARAVAQEFLRFVEERAVLTPEAYKEILTQVKETTRQKGKALFHPIRAALTGRGSGPELERLVPLYEEGSRLILPRKVMSCRERLRAVLSSLK